MYPGEIVIQICSAGNQCREVHYEMREHHNVSLLTDDSPCQSYVWLQKIAVDQDRELNAWVIPANEDGGHKACMFGIIQGCQMVDNSIFTIPGFQLLS